MTLMNRKFTQIGFAAALLAGWPGSAPVSPEAVVLAGGCYWGVEAVFEHLRGVTSVTSGFAVPAVDPGTPPGPRGPRHTTYAEAVRILYDPTQISHAQLLEVFFAVAHDPTLIDRQGPDVGPEYRSAIFVDSAEEARLAGDYVARLESAKVFPRPIATEIVTLRRFREAAPDQQDFVARHPNDPYVVANDLGKLDALRRRFPALYRAP